MSRHTYTKKNKIFIEENYKGISTRELLKRFNEEFGTNLRHAQIKSYKDNRSMNSGYVHKPKTRIPKQHLEYIMDNYRGISTKELTTGLNKEFGSNYKVSQLQSYKVNHKLPSGYDAKFDKGHEPVNKGTKGMFNVGGNKTSFKKGNKSHNKRKVGSERVDRDGYLLVKVANPSTWKYKHRVIWEEEHGPIPDKHRVIFLDQDKTNIVLENLRLVSFGVSAVMSKTGMYFEDAELTKAGSLISEIKIRSNQKRKEKE